jgi:hypothetical protein
MIGYSFVDTNRDIQQLSLSVTPVDANQEDQVTAATCGKRLTVASVYLLISLLRRPSQSRNLSNATAF